jgi:TPR repeat protein
MCNILKNKMVIFCLLLVCAFSFSVRAEEADLQAIKARAEQGEVDAQVQLGLFYANGMQVEKDYAIAKQWWEKAAQQGNASAKYFIGYMYAGGAGVEKDKLIAKDWWEQAAEQDNIGALFNLGMLYVEGDVVQGSYVEAGKYFTRAAELGNVQAQFNVGMLYANGLGYPQSNEYAYAWAKFAADRGHPSAAELIQNLEKQMDAEQLALAKMKHDELKGQFEIEK